MEERRDTKGTEKEQPQRSWETLLPWEWEQHVREMLVPVSKESGLENEHGLRQKVFLLSGGDRDGQQRVTG